jgi:hypothetical protein
MKKSTYRQVIPMALLFLFVTGIVQAGQPTISIFYPRQNEVIGLDDVDNHKLVAYQQGFSYSPELAVPASRWGSGVSVLGNPIVFGEGHIHGWLFLVAKDGDIVKPDVMVPTGSDYIRFYGATWSDFVSWGQNQGFATRIDDWSNLDPGLYELRIVAQNHDHTALRQPSAPAYQEPVEDRVRFRLVRRGPKK